MFAYLLICVYVCPCACGYVLCVCMHVSVYGVCAHACEYVCVSARECARMSCGADKGIQSSRTAITEGCELPSGFWELDLGPQEECPVF